MTSDGEIVAEFERREAEAGGRLVADQKAILRDTAEALGVTYTRARDAVLDWWDMSGAG